MNKVTLVLVLGLIVAGCAVQGTQDYRTFDMNWTVKVDGIPEGTNTAKLWIALPQDRPEQTVSNVRVETDYPWEIVEDPDFGNQVVLVRVSNPSPNLQVGLAASVKRLPVSAPQPASLTHEESKLYLREEALVSLSPRIQQLADSLGENHRARYDYVMSLMEYDKQTPGWGRGDSERACDVRKGNCTDYHSLFMSLCRVQGVPAVFEMGYTTTPEGEVDRAGGYHCWAWFYKDGAWMAVDISEADKNPEKTDYFYGNLDPDRIIFSRGRDVRLPEMEGPPLNYLPSGAYVEVDGMPFDGVTRSLTYQVESPDRGAES